VKRLTGVILGYPRRPLQEHRAEAPARWLLLWRKDSFRWSSPLFPRKGRAVLWGQRPCDWQIGSREDGWRMRFDRAVRAARHAVLGAGVTYVRIGGSAAEAAANIRRMGENLERAEREIREAMRRRRV
jgi:hypothetical protein